MLCLHGALDLFLKHPPCCGIQSAVCAHALPIGATHYIAVNTTTATAEAVVTVGSSAITLTGGVTVAVVDVPPPPQLTTIKVDASAKATLSCLTSFMIAPSELANTLRQVVKSLNQNGLVRVNCIHIDDLSCRQGYLF